MGHIMNILHSKNIKYDMNCNNLNQLVQKLQPQFPKIPELNVKFVKEVNLCDPFIEKFNQFKA